MPLVSVSHAHASAPQAHRAIPLGPGASATGWAWPVAQATRQMLTPPSRTQRTRRTRRSRTGSPTRSSAILNSNAWRCFDHAAGPHPTTNRWRLRRRRHVPRIESTFHTRSSRANDNNNNQNGLLMNVLLSLYRTSHNGWTDARLIKNNTICCSNCF